MRRGGYLKIAGVRSILDGAAGAAIRNDTDTDRPAAPTHLPPGLSACSSPGQLPEAVCGFRRPGRADQPLLPSSAATVRRSIKLTPFTTLACPNAPAPGIPRCLR